MFWVILIVIIVIIVLGVKVIPQSQAKVIERLEKSIPPNTKPRIGVKMLFTKLVTIDEKAPPIITPTAKSMTFPLAINFLNSLIFFFILPPVFSTLFYHILNIKKR